MPYDQADGAAAGRGRRRTITVVLAAGGLVLALAVTLVTQSPWAGASTLGLTGLAALAATATGRAKARRDQAAFIADFGGSMDRVRAVLDVVAVRRIRDEKGELHAVRDVRRTVPQLSLERAVEVVRTL